MSKKESKPVSRKSDIVVQEYGNEVLIYDLIINKAFSLNETSSLVWQACDGNKTVSEISNQISRQLNSHVNEDFVWLALEQLKKENLIENESELAAPFEGLSRREVIRKVGLASLIALPVISSLIAPMAINAQSGGCRQTRNNCTGAGRTNGCQCSTATIAGTPGGGPSGGGNPSNCRADLSCFSVANPNPANPRLSACCQSATQL